MNSITSGDREAAARLADQIQQAEANGQRRSWRKVATLVNLFGGTRLTSGLRARMAAALDEAGLEVEPPLLDSNVTRADYVRLLTRGRPSAPQPYVQDQQVAADPSTVPDDTNAVSYSVWTHGMKARTSGPVENPRRSVMLLQVNPNMEPAEAVLQVMQPHCNGLLTLEMVKDLLTADPHPELDATDKKVRRLSTIGAKLAGEEDVPEGGESLAGSLEFAPVEYLIGDGWLIICWHNFTNVETEVSSRGVGTLREQVVQRVEEQWVAADARTAGDLAALVTIELASQYRVPLREMESWLDQWEQNAGRATENDKVEVQTLVDTQLQLSEFIRRLHWFRDIKSVTGENWFPGTTSPDLYRSLTTQIDTSVDRLDYMRASVRADIELANMHNLRYQLEKTDQRQREDDKARSRSEEFQRNLSYLAAIFLAPSLVAAI